MPASWALESHPLCHQFDRPQWFDMSHQLGMADEEALPGLRTKTFGTVGFTFISCAKERANNGCKIKYAGKHYLV